MTVQTWHIVGAGAIGSWCAYALAKHQLRATLIFRHEQSYETFNRNGPLCVHHQGQVSDIQIDSTYWRALGPHSIQHVIVATKSWQNAAALQTLRPYLAPDATVVLMQNGYGQLQSAQHLLKQHRYYAASTTNGGYKSDLNTLHVAGIGQTQVGPYNTRAKHHTLSLPIANHCTTIDDVLWRKLCINAAINPLTALYDINNGELLYHTKARQIITSLSQELAQISLACGHHGLDRDTIEAMVIQVCDITANNSSSMREDIRHQRRTEIQEICGFLTVTATSKGLVTPMLQSLQTQIIALEQANDSL